ncbi:hypothetical protein [Frankia sp. Cas3]|uniref:hypothetical protein n=1 Tax=Frankia sp. Cas3 TaxID=3073926 RepID=UPI002AD2B1D4|nr:hypothetical protein [Frankia sp. Cas3]
MTATPADLETLRAESLARVAAAIEAARTRHATQKAASAAKTIRRNFGLAARHRRHLDRQDNT